RSTASCVFSAIWCSSLGRTQHRTVGDGDGIPDPEETEQIRTAETEGQRLDPLLARKLRRAANKVRRILRISQEPMSLEMPVGEEDSSFLGDFIEDDKMPGPVDVASRQLLKEQIRSALGVLSDREREVLELFA
ncbi:hypothetical protein HC891_13290, partial [Candidatus Gracilibacteria bacterium]|nr:hypothetical protein [Candidatus Gracilibacteria bacterium]